MSPTRTHVIACATVIEEMLPILPPDVGHEVLDFGLHVSPERLRNTVQEAIDRLQGTAETVILGYGLCSQAVLGLRATGCRLVVPRVHDCITLFLGSAAAYRAQTQAEPGTYYLTKGWIEVGDSPFAQHDRLVERYGPERAERLTRLLLANYTRVALINTGQRDMDRYRAYARQAAERFGLRFEEIPGSTALLRRMIHGPWDEDFVVVSPGGVVRYEDFAPLLFGPSHTP